MEPRKFARELKNMTVKCDEKVKFKCELSEAGLTVNWMKDGQELYIDNDRVYTESNGRTHRLVINQVNSEDVGEYTAVYEQLFTTASLSVRSESRVLYFTIQKKMPQLLRFRHKCPYPNCCGQINIQCEISSHFNALWPPC